MTLGEIEWFWQTILGEFLQRAQFTSYEDAADRSKGKELVYDARKDIGYEQDLSTQLRSTGEDHRRAVGMDRAAHHRANEPRDGHQSGAFEPMAEPGHGSHGGGAESEKTRETGDAGCPSDPADREEPTGSGRQAGKAPQGGTEDCESQTIVALDSSHGIIEPIRPASSVPAREPK